MKVVVRNLHCEVVRSSVEEEKKLSQSLSFYSPNYQYTRAYKMGYWDGKKKFYHKGSKTFPTGLLPFVADLWSRQEWSLLCSDLREHLQPKKVFDDGLRDYQKRELSRILSRSLEVGNKQIPFVRGIVKMPTGSGKTHLAGALLRSLSQPTLYLVERLDLLYQTKEVLEGILDKGVGLIGDGKFDLQKYTIATVQTISNLDSWKFLKEIGCLLIDECHHDSEGRYHEISKACPAFYRFGFSATPLSRKDLGDVMLIADTGDIIAQVERSELEEKGHLAKPTVFLYEVEEPSDEDLSWQEAYKQLVVHNPVRNTLICKEAKEAVKIGLPTLILVRYLDHGHLLAAQLKHQFNVSCIFLKGEDEAEDRRKALKGFGKNSQVVIATGIFDEGVDAPEVRVVILACGGSSKIKSIQRIGRGLRPKKGSNTVRVVDFVDKVNGYLLNHSKERLRTYKAEGFEMQVVKSKGQGNLFSS